MPRFTSLLSSLIVAALLLVSPTAGAAQEVPQQYRTVLEALGKSGDFKEGVLKVNIPRTDLRVTIGGRPAPTPFGFGGLRVAHGLQVRMDRHDQGHRGSRGAHG